MTLKELLVNHLTRADGKKEYPRIIEMCGRRDGIPMEVLLTFCAETGNVALAKELCKADYKKRAEMAKGMGYRVKVSKKRGFYGISK